MPRYPPKWGPKKVSKADYIDTEKLRKRHGPLTRRGPLSLQRPTVGETALERRAVPMSEVYGSLPERIMYKALLDRSVTFDFQSSMEGGRLELGGMVADFVLLDRPVIIRVQGEVWHQGIESEARDEEHRAILQNMGYDVFDIWDWEIYDGDILDDWLERHIEKGLV